MQTKTILVAVLAVLVIILGAFYWYSWRPTQIKQRCYAEAEFDKRATFENDDSKRQEFIDVYYKDCLLRFGVEK